MTAARTGVPAAVKTLLAHGADVNAKESWRGQTALMWAAAEGHAETIEAAARSGRAGQRAIEHRLDRDVVRGARRKDSSGQGAARRRRERRRRAACASGPRARRRRGWRRRGWCRRTASAFEGFQRARAGGRQRPLRAGCCAARCRCRSQRRRARVDGAPSSDVDSQTRAPEATIRRRTAPATWTA